MAYREPATCAKWAAVSGFTGPFDFFDNAGTQGFVAESTDAINVAFRGTQPNRPMDWFVDFRATRGAWDHDVGHVHDGFYRAPRKVWGVALANGEILKGGIEKIEDRSMDDHYLIGLETKLPSV
jgi:hypothetical protein